MLAVGLIVRTGSGVTCRAHPGRAAEYASTSSPESSASTQPPGKFFEPNERLERGVVGEGEARFHRLPAGRDGRGDRRRSSPRQGSRGLRGFCGDCGWRGGFSGAWGSGAERAVAVWLEATCGVCGADVAVRRRRVVVCASRTLRCSLRRALRVAGCGYDDSEAMLEITEHCLCSVEEAEIAISH